MLRISHAHQRRFWSIVANWVSKALTVSKSAHDDQWWDLVILVIFCLNLWKTEAPLCAVITVVHEAVTVGVVTVWCTHLHAVCWECDLAGRPGVSGGCRAGGPLYVDSATPATHLLKMPHRRAACSYQRGDTHAAAGQHADTRRQELSTLEFN